MTLDTIVVLVAIVFAVLLVAALATLAVRRAGTAGVVHWLETFEPARLRAGVIAVLALAATAGFTVSDVLSGRIGLVLTVLGLVVPVLQGELTRATVYAPGTVQPLLEHVAGRSADDVTELAGRHAALVELVQPLPTSAYPAHAVAIPTALAGTNLPTVDAVPALIETADVPPSPLSDDEQDAAGGDHPGEDNPSS